MRRSSCTRIPPREVESFLRGLPDVRLFPHHSDRRVRAIALTDLYRAALAGLDFLVRFLGRHGITDHLLAICADLETSLHPFLADNRRMRGNVARLARIHVAELEATPEPDSWDLYLLGSLSHAEPQLAPAVRRRSRRILEAIAERLRAAPGFDDGGVASVVIESFAASGTRPAVEPDAEEAWEHWLHQVVEARYAHDLGAQIDLDAFYARTVADLVEIPFARSYALELFNVMTHAAYGLSAYHRIALRDHAVANRLADHGLSLLRWWREQGLYPDDPEILAAFVDAFLKGTSRGYGSTPEFGSIVRLLLDTQGSDGGWHPNDGAGEGASEEMDLYPLYHPTWVCVDALRPVANDLLDPDNRRLGLV
ncbi:MAG: hypothetical protein ACRD0X_06930 [Thermoanaerobaculia bacterium]